MIEAIFVYMYVEYVAGADAKGAGMLTQMPTIYVAPGKT
jgi:hypothetical protein